VALMAVSGTRHTVASRDRGKGFDMRKRFVVAAVVVVVLVLIGATFAFGGGRGLIWDDGHYAKPGSLDDGKDLLSQTQISLGQAVAAAQRAQSGRLGQVDLERDGARIVYMVDVGDREVRVDSADGSIVSIQARD
jgi:hypothetical protein